MMRLQISILITPDLLAVMGIQRLGIISAFINLTNLAISKDVVLYNIFKIVVSKLNLLYILQFIHIDNT